MKSTGLFGKNSGKVGGVVYSNYRGQQIVRSYQPQVKNPSTKGQIEQRAKFKLVSQLGASLGRELSISYMPNDRKMSARNSWVQRMLKSTIYSNGEASLPIEEIVLTNARGGIIGAEAIGGLVDVVIPALSWDIDKVKVRGVCFGYSNGGEIVALRNISLSPSDEQLDDSVITFSSNIGDIARGYSNIRMVLYAYQPNDSTSVSYEDYEVQGEEVTLSDIVRTVGLSNVLFSESVNIPVPQNV